MTSAKPARGLRAVGVAADNSEVVDGVEAEVVVASEAEKAAGTSPSPQLYKREHASQ